MKKKFMFVFASVILLFSLGCSDTPEQIARNSIATATAVISKAQSGNTASCQGKPDQQVCVAINKAVDAQNLAITGLETFCGFSLSPQPPDASAKCTPNKSAGANLNTVVNNLNQAINELKTLIGKNTSSIPLDPQPIYAGITPGAIALASLGLKTLLDSILNGKTAQVADTAIDAIKAGIDELQSVQGTEITLGQLEAMRLHHLWPESGSTGQQTPAKQV